MLGISLIVIHSERGLSGPRASSDSGHMSWPGTSTSPAVSGLLNATWQKSIESTTTSERQRKKETLLCGRLEIVWHNWQNLNGDSMHSPEKSRGCDVIDADEPEPIRDTYNRLRDGPIVLHYAGWIE